MATKAQLSVKSGRFAKRIGNHATNLLNFSNFTFTRQFYKSDWWSLCYPIPTDQNRSDTGDITTVSSVTNDSKRKVLDQCGGYLITYICFKYFLTKTHFFHIIN